MKTKKKSSPKMEHFFPQIQVKTKKTSSSKIEHFFFPNSSGHLRSDAHQSQIVGGCRCRPYSNYWGDTVKLMGDISLIPPWVSAPLPATPSNQFLPANLNVNLEEMDSFRPKSCYLRITSSLFMNVMH